MQAVVRYLLYAVMFLGPSHAVRATDAPVPTDLHTAVVGDIELYYRESGSGDKQPLVMIHGAFGSSQLWRDIVPLLSHRVRVITPDTRGKGYTAAGTRPFTLVQMADDVLKLLDNLGIERDHVAGHSQGAAVVMTLLAHNEHRVKSASLSGMTHDRNLIRPEWTSRHRRMCSDAMNIRAGNRDLENFKQTWLSFGRSEAEFPEHVKAHCQLWEEGSMPFSEEQLADSKVPVLIFRAGSDPVVSVEALDALAALFTEATVVNIPEATHGLPRQMPHEYAEFWLAFLDSL